MIEHQKKTFRQHIELAHELNLALVVHTRQGQRARDSASASSQSPNAYDDVYEILKLEMGNGKLDSNFQLPTSNLRFVMHCFSGTLEHAKKFLDLGGHLSFTGIITFKNAHDLREVIRQTPLERICIETDSPYLAPEPYRGKRNEPMNVIEVAETIARVKEISLEEVAEQTTANARFIFLNRVL